MGDVDSRLRGADAQVARRLAVLGRARRWCRAFVGLPELVRRSAIPTSGRFTLSRPEVTVSSEHNPWWVLSFGRSSGPALAGCSSCAQRGHLDRDVRSLALFCDVWSVSHAEEGSGKMHAGFRAAIISHRREDW